MKEKLNLLKDKFLSFYKTTYGMLITISWVLLIICLIIKLFGGNWFELNAENSKFIQFCLYVDNHEFLKRSIALLVCLFTTIPVYCIMLNNKKPKIIILLLLIFLTILKSVISWYNTIISFSIDVFIMLGVMTFINKKFKRNIVCFILVSIFQVITILIRNISFEFNTYNTSIENILYQIDYYIMILLWYLYNFYRKEKK